MLTGQSARARPAGRFLRDRRYDVDAADTKIRKMLEWRKDFGWAHLLHGKVPPPYYLSHTHAPPTPYRRADELTEEVVAEQGHTLCAKYPWC